jgi:hypothetical protein
MPQSVVRFIQFSSTEHPPPFAVSAFAAFTFSSSGFLNVFLYIYTRPSLLSQNSPPEDDELMDNLPDNIRADILPALEMDQNPVSRTMRQNPSYSDAYGEDKDLETMESVDELRRQLGEHERSLGQIRAKLTRLSRRRGTAVTS